MGKETIRLYIYNICLIDKWECSVSTTDPRTFMDMKTDVYVVDIPVPQSVVGNYMELGQFNLEKAEQDM